MNATFRLALLLPVFPLAVACHADVAANDVELASTSQALSACAEPAPNHGSLCELGGGQIKFQVTLPSGQQYVEVFSRQNGLQNVAQNIVANGHARGDGYTTYSLTRGGYAEGDYIEYRFYSYLPNAPGVFTPGPQEFVWLDHELASPEFPVTKDASLIASSYGTGPSADRNFGADDTVDVAGYHHDSRGLFGYDIARLQGSVVTKAELVIPHMTAPGGSFGRFALSKVDDSTSWQEDTVTWLTAPSATFVDFFDVDTTTENRIDITMLVADAVAAGETEISFLLDDVQNNLFIDSKENPSGLATYLYIEYSAE